MLIAIVVLGVAAVAMLVAFGTAFTASQEHRNLTNIAKAQKSVTQQIVAQLQNEGLYSSCAPVATYQTGANAVKFTNLPKGYSAQVTGVSYWTAAFVFSATQAQCVANGPQLISATVTYPTGQSSIVTAVVNNPTLAHCRPPAGDASISPSTSSRAGPPSGQNLSPQPVVEVLDSDGNVVTNDLRRSCDPQASAARTAPRCRAAAPERELRRRLLHRLQRQARRHLHHHGHGRLLAGAR